VIFGAQGNDGIGILTWVAAVFISILIHESGHAAVMRAFGFRPWIVLYGMGGLACHGSRESLRFRKFDDSLGQILICAAGPVAGFLLGALLILGFIAAGYRDRIVLLDIGPWKLLPAVQLSNIRLAIFVYDIMQICVFWGLVNLLPVYPLDGGQIARELLLRLSPRDGIAQSMLVSMITAGGVAVYGYVQWHSLYIGIFFAYLAYMSLLAFQSYTGRGGWR
jgi:stage IV sporulation protein FB